MDIRDCKVYIDAGHGDQDPGAVAPDGTKEKDINLIVANRLNTILVAWGVPTKMTRTGDTYVDPTDIPGLVNSWGADIFVSIHCNSGGAGGLGGTETWTPRNPSYLTKNLAIKVNNGLVSAFGSNNRGVKEKNFDVFSGNNAYCCLAELLFMDVPSDLEMLKSSFYQGRAAAAIANALDSFAWENL